MSGSQRPGGRYRFQGERPLDPDEGVHPEMVDSAAVPPPSGTGGSAIPSSPSELIAMQEHPLEGEGLEPAERPESPRVRQVLDLIESLDTAAWEDQQIALAIVRHLEGYHDQVVSDMRDSEEADHGQLVCWAIDADRLMQCRRLLESVDLA